MKFVQPIRDEKLIEEIRHVLKMQSIRNLVLFEIGINLGCRIGDTLQLKVKDVRGIRFFEVRPEKQKTKAVRVPVREKLRALLDDYTQMMKDDDYLFPSRKGGKPITRQQAWQILNAAAKELQVDFRFGTHSMRKTMAYFMYQQTKDLELIRMLFNHSSQRVTRAYIGLDDDDLSDAVNSLPY